MLDVQAFHDGALSFLAAFGMSVGVLLLFKLLYQLVTPYNELRLIREGNSCAATTMAGAMLGFALPVAMSLSQASGWAEFLAWAALAGVIQILVFVLVRLVLFRDLGTRIEAGEKSVALYLAAISITAGILNAASMTE